MTAENLRRVNQFVKERPAFTGPSIRWLIHNAKTNGLAESGAIIRIGRAIYIDPERFDEWLDSKRDKAAA